MPGGQYEGTCCPAACWDPGTDSLRLMSLDALRVRYRSYVVMVESVSCRAYDAARRRPGLPRCWRETTGMFKFPLESVRRQFMERNGELTAFESHNH